MKKRWEVWRIDLSPAALNPPDHPIPVAKYALVENVVERTYFKRSAKKACAYYNSIAGYSGEFIQCHYEIRRAA